MDVKYRPEPWQNMGDGMNRITKDALMKLREANESLKRIDGRIRDLDSDGSIHFNPKDQSQKIGELLDSYTTLQKYCGEAGRLVSEHIDKPFLVEMDKFAQKMRDTSILSFETNNRIGSTTTTVLPGAHAGYGSVPQTIQKKKDKITVEDIFKDSPAFDNVLRGEYKELKKQNPDAKLNYEEYKKVVPSTRGFEYKSIEDEQKKLEMVRDIGIGVGIIITTILCPPLGAAAAVVYGAVQIKSGIDGEDWGTHRKLSQEERVGNIIFGGLDAIPVVGAVGKGVKAFKGTSELADLAKLLKFKEGMPGFNPNLGKNVVQSLKENKNLKNALDAMKNTPIPVAVRMVDTGIGMRLPYIESSTVGEVAGKFSKASTAAKDDAYQLAKGSGGGKGTGESRLEYLRGKYGELTSEQLHANINERAGIAFPQRSTRSQLKNGGYIVEDVDLYKKMSPNKNRALGFRNTKNDGLVQAHHAIQDEWAKIWAKTSGNNYSSRQAPSILLKSTSGEPHAIISALQRARRRNEGFSTNIIYEFNISYKEMIEAGVDLKVAKKVMREAYRYFDGLGGFK
ncbi:MULTISPECIES: hypothetical protein [Bacillus cereus group]|uniref:hypothetical protein n=2 Tax=Bacillus cereus group TaxID=86661 RepID=UPI000BF5E4FC|nr:MULTISPECIES: hypothetical protein [Bacillus cereus group]MCU5357110.1 hypothetical protein [Bacillus cereus]MDA2433988.1 hypothetical protein [Bacillus cereus]MDA2545023.1 hypothetical protein [Bacillus cereus]MDA2551463.1 hypothetical protein [Bacillus cereus]MDA2648345.1 hypothetical protein [Bacillus cereus]